MGFSADLTGLQSLNNSYHVPSYPLYTLSNWAWHSPDPKLLSSKQPMFRPDGSLNYVYENVSINSSDARPGKGNRTVPYQFNCDKYNDPALCQYQHTFPARANLAQLGFVLPGRAAGRGPSGPHAGCSGLGSWCNTGQVQHDHATGSYTCTRKIAVQPAAASQSDAACNETASCEWSGGWKDAPFCAEADGRIRMSGVHPGVHDGYFDGSCDRIKWNNSFDSSSWCRAGSAACSPAAAATGGEPAGDFRWLQLQEISAADQSLDMWSGVLSSNWSHTDPHSQAVSEVRVSTAMHADSDTLSTRYSAPATLGLGVQLAFCTISRGGGACEWRPFGDPSGPLEEHKTTVLGKSSEEGGGRLDLHRENGHDSYAVSCSWAGEGLELQQTSQHSFALHRPPTTNAQPEEEVTVEVSCRFELVCCVGTTGPLDPKTLSAKQVPSATSTLASSERGWRDFWESGAFVDIAGATSDAQAFELERRTIQSMFLLRAQEAGSIAPQESALL